jgi:hypothetical protein
MTATELRIGNYYYGCSRKQLEIVTGQTIAQRESGELPCMKPIPLTEEWLLKLPKDLDLKDIPSWINYIHELQNWYFIQNKCKKELIFM